MPSNKSDDKYKANFQQQQNFKSILARRIHQRCGSSKNDDECRRPRNAWIQGGEFHPTVCSSTLGTAVHVLCNVRRDVVGHLGIVPD